MSQHLRILIVFCHNFHIEGVSTMDALYHDHVFATQIEFDPAKLAESTGERLALNKVAKPVMGAMKDASVSVAEGQREYLWAEGASARTFATIVKNKPSFPSEEAFVLLRLPMIEGFVEKKELEIWGEAAREALSRHLKAPVERFIDASGQNGRLNPEAANFRQLMAETFSQAAMVAQREAKALQAIVDASGISPTVETKPARIPRSI